MFESDMVTDGAPVVTIIHVTMTPSGPNILQCSDRQTEFVYTIHDWLQILL